MHMMSFDQIHSLFPQPLSPPNFVRFVFSAHLIHFALSGCVGLGPLLGVCRPLCLVPLKKTELPQQSPVANSSSAVRVLCGLNLPLRVPLCSCPAVSVRNAVLLVLHHLWLLEFVHPLSAAIPKLRRERISMHHLGWSTLQSLIFADDEI